MGIGAHGQKRLGLCAGSIHVRHPQAARLKLGSYRSASPSTPVGRSVLGSSLSAVACESSVMDLRGGTSPEKSKVPLKSLTCTL